MRPDYQISEVCTPDILAGDFRPGGYRDDYVIDYAHQTTYRPPNSFLRDVTQGPTPDPMMWVSLAKIVSNVFIASLAAGMFLDQQTGIWPLHSRQLLQRRRNHRKAAFVFLEGALQEDNDIKKWSYWFLKQNKKKTIRSVNRMSVVQRSSQVVRSPYRAKRDGYS